MLRPLRRTVLIGLPLAMAARPVLAAAPSAYALDLQFTDDQGAARPLSDWRSKAVIITLAYGACRNVCSSSVRTLEMLQVAADSRSIPLEFVVVSIDPSEDTPAAWADFRRSHKLTRANWTFLCGTPGVTRALARFLGVRFWRYDEHVMHDFRIARLGSEGEIVAVLDWEHRDVERLF